MPSVTELLAEGRAAGLDPVDVRVLACAVFGVAAAWLRGHDRDEVDAATAARLRDSFSRRQAGEPVAYITGQREFFGLDLRVAPGVLIPRPDTELLVDLALAHLGPGFLSMADRPKGEGVRVLDLGTGSGAIALALKSRLPQAEVTGVDVSTEALAIARDNGARLALQVDWQQGAWFDPVPGQRFHLILSNPPYIVPGDAHLQQGDLRFEPMGALVGAQDGLGDIRHIIRGAPDHLLPGAWLLFEHGYDQASVCRHLLGEAGFAEVQSWTDLAGIERVSGGCWRTSSVDVGLDASVVVK